MNADEEKYNIQQVLRDRAIQVVEVVMNAQHPQSSDGWSVWTANDNRTLTVESTRHPELDSVLGALEEAGYESTVESESPRVVVRVTGKA